MHLPSRNPRNKNPEIHVVQFHMAKKNWPNKFLSTIPPPRTIMKYHLIYYQHLRVLLKGTRGYTSNIMQQRFRLCNGPRAQKHLTHLEKLQFLEPEPKKTHRLNE